MHEGHYVLAQVMQHLPLTTFRRPAQRQSGEAVRRVKEALIKAGAKLDGDNVYGLELENGSRVLALPSNDDSIRGLTVDGWIIADEAARLADDLIAALRPMRARRPERTYLEGWYAISEANRIFGFDGWNRETVESKCALARENRSTFLAVYIARVRVTVHADGATIIREGHGTGEGRGTSPGEVHDIALKAAETDAIKRALTTFGKPFGLELYRGGKAAVHQRSLPAPSLSVLAVPVPADVRVGSHPDDTTPIPRPSRYYGRRDNQLAQHFREERRQAERTIDTSARMALSPAPLWRPGPSLLSYPIASTRACCGLPSQKDYATKRISNSSPRNPASSAAGSPLTRITCGLPNPERWVSKSVTSSPCHSAAVLIGSYIRPAMRWLGGRASRLMPCQLPRGFGSRRDHNLRRQISIPMKTPPRPRRKTECEAKTGHSRLMPGRVWQLRKMALELADETRLVVTVLAATHRE